MNLADELKKNPSAESLASILDSRVSEESFWIFRDRKFRELASFDSLPQVEQDRIFNELVPAALVLCMFTLEAPDLRVSDEQKAYYQEVAKILPQTHVALLKSYGIEQQFLYDWDRLIAMRYKEYNEDKTPAREAAIILEEGEKRLTPEGLSGITLALPLQVVAVGCHHHISRGKTEGQDELYMHIFRWLSQFYLDVRVPLEGGKITLWMKLRRKFAKASFGTIDLKIRIPSFLSAK